jgi:hypothetical protein
MPNPTPMFDLQLRRFQDGRWEHYGFYSEAALALRTKLALCAAPSQADWRVVDQRTKKIVQS